jgi:hypothetical protein
LNEIKCCNHALRRMKSDLEFAIRIMKGSEHCEIGHPTYAVIQSFLKNDIPDRWYDISSLPVIHSDNLVDFFKIFFLKYECLFTLIRQRDCKMYPQIPINKLFDPFFLFSSMIWAYSHEHKVNCNNNLIYFRFLFTIVKLFWNQKTSRLQNNRRQEEYI